MIQLNLLPDIKKELVRAQRMRAKVTMAAIVASLLAIGLLILSAAWVYAVQPITLKYTRDSIDQNEQLLRQKKDTRKYLTLQNQLSALPELHGNKTIASRLMAFLPVLNPNEPNRIKLTSVVFSKEGTSLTISGRAATFEAQNVFTDTLKHAKLRYSSLEERAPAVTEPMFTSVHLQSSALTRDSGQERVSFTVQATYSENAFSNRVENATVSVPLINDSKSIDQATIGDLFEEVKKQDD